MVSFSRQKQKCFGQEIRKEYDELSRTSGDGARCQRVVRAQPSWPQGEWVEELAAGGKQSELVQKQFLAAPESEEAPVFRGQPVRSNTNAQS